VYLPTIMYTKN